MTIVPLERKFNYVDCNCIELINSHFENNPERNIISIETITPRMYRVWYWEYE